MKRLFDLILALVGLIIKEQPISVAVHKPWLNAFLVLVVLTNKFIILL